MNVKIVVGKNIELYKKEISTMKLIAGVAYFPRLFSEAQCPECSRILEWRELEPQKRVKAQCCNKIFIAILNYVGITIEDIKDINVEEILNIDRK
jgi:hypothetical protein